MNNLFYRTAGFILLFLNKIRHALQGYQTPRAFPITEFDRAIEYDLNSVDNLVQFGLQYAGPSFTMKDKVILELGPGADLGVGLISLMHGARKYNAMDVHDLVSKVPGEFYEKLFKRMETIEGDRVSVDFLRSQLEAIPLGTSRLNHVCRKDFDLSVFREERINLVISQAAFEHFEDVERTIRELSQIVTKGTIFIAEIDLKTHTRWIRDKDPLNIYRYSQFIYDLFKFRGSPNRLRPYEYEEILKRNGWENIQIMPWSVLEEPRASRLKRGLSRAFREPKNQMHLLDIMVGATKS